MLLFFGFVGGSWVQSKVCFGSSAADHVLFSPATCKDFLLTQKETSQICSWRGIFESVQFWKLVFVVFQLSKEEGNEEKTEDNLTTLFPGQKRRISHLVKQGNVSATFRRKSLDSLKRGTSVLLTTLGNDAVPGSGSSV